MKHSLHRAARLVNMKCDVTTCKKARVEGSEHCAHHRNLMRTFLPPRHRDDERNVYGA